MRGARGFLAGLLAGALVLTGLLLAVPAARQWLPRLAATSEETVVQTTLQAVRREQKLLVFTAWITADVTSAVQKTFFDMAVPGASVRQTWIVPGLVRYAIDLSTLGDADLVWDKPGRTLTVTMPPVVPLEPAVQLERIKVYSEKGLLVPFTDLEQVAEGMNRAAITKDMLAQARTAELMRLAEEAAAEALRNSFLVPMRAAGLEDVQVNIVRPGPEAIG